MEDSITKQNADYKAIGFKKWFAWVLVGIIFAGMLLYSLGRMFVFPSKAKLAEYNWDKNQAFDSSMYPTLTAADDGSFRILQLTDMHFFSGTGKLDKKTFDLAQRLIQTSSPDLVVVTGDTTFSIDNVSALNRWIDFVDQICIQRGIKWAYVFGNHDTTGYGDKTKLCELLTDSSECLFSVGPTNLDDGKYGYTLGNYAINIVDNTNTTKCSLIMIDSNETGKDKNEGSYAPISLSTIEWYEWYINGISGVANQTVSSLAFFHIPLYEAKIAAQNKGSEDGVNESINASESNTGMFAKMKSLGSTKATFSGHDHQNYYEFDCEGILLTCCVSCGYNTYGKKQYKGGRVIDVNINDSALITDTYILFADELN